ncbi:MAG TPA: DNA methyltransferase [Terriglobia bacterium]|nr:DNA methyltransferase [Terriglobia bacterium]
MQYVAIRSEGGLIPYDILDQIAREEIAGQKGPDFGLSKGRRLTDEIQRVWSDAQNLWDIFSRRRDSLSEKDPYGTTLTRDRWMVPLLADPDLFGYELTLQPSGAVVNGVNYPISHRAGHGEEAPPVYIEGCRVDLDHRAAKLRTSPRAILQDYLNNTERHLWGALTNGLSFRLLRNTARASRPTYLDFDLESILRDSRFNEFALFYRLCHRSRLPHLDAEPTDCFLETYYQQSIEQGGRVRDHLRDGVEKAITMLGTGFLRHPANLSLKERLTTGKLAAAEYHRQLLRLIYRLLFLMVAEERGLIASTGQDDARRQAVYRDHYSVNRLRDRAEEVVEASAFSDLWLGLQRSFALFSYGPDDNVLGIPPLNGDLFSRNATADLDGTHLYNHDFLVAIRHISMFRAEGVQQRVNYSQLNVEELGSIYESLLDFHPTIADQPEGPAFELQVGSDRKTTGSYYTRPELVHELIESALVPVMEQRLAAAVAADATLKDGLTATKEKAILSMTVCDPACGSGHFLLAAARRLGRELAKIKTGEDEPTPEAFHGAVRDVIAHSIYGVDLNPLAVDLCKLALWLEGHWTGKPLSFLDHHIKCGNSLIGVLDSDVLKQGIPDDAFIAVTGDSKDVAKAIKKRNRKEREDWERGQRGLPFSDTVLDKLEGYAANLHELGEIAENSPADVKRKAELYRKVYESPESERAHRAADLWTAAFFVLLKDPSDPAVPTHDFLMEFLERPVGMRAALVKADELKLKQRFFHWHLEFPEVFANGGFDVALGNPPWERIKLEEQEFFATRDLAIAEAPNKAARQRLIDQLSTTTPVLAQEFEEAKHDAEAGSKFVRSSGRYPLTAVGDVNTYALFADLSRQLMNRRGSVGILLPTGIATDDTTKAFFSEVAEKQSLARLIGFENEAFIFPAVHHSFKFCAFTLKGEQGNAEQADFAFFCRHFEDVRDQSRHFKLTRDDFRLLNPNTLTCPVFRTHADAELTKKIYRRVPVLVNERTGGNPWGIHFMAMFHMSNDSALFENARKDGLVSLYESKMVYHFDHRYETFEGATRAQLNVGSLPQPSAEQKQDPSLCVRPRYWVSKAELNGRLERWNREGTELIWRWERDWLLAFRDVTSAVVERTSIFSLLPRVGVGNNAPLAILDKDTATFVCCLLGNLNTNL